MQKDVVIGIFLIFLLHLRLYAQILCVLSLRVCVYVLSRRC